MQAKNESPDRNGVQSRDSFFLFIAAKRPPGYLLLFYSMVSESLIFLHQKSRYASYSL